MLNKLVSSIDMADDKAWVWFLPISRHIIITDLPGAVPMECCNLPEQYSKQLEDLTGSRGVVHEFETWIDAVGYSNNLLKDKMKGWDVEYDNWMSRCGGAYD